MLDALSSYSTPEALGVLSKLTRHLVPEPFEGTEDQGIGKLDFRADNVLNEIRARIGIAQNDDSDKARDKIIRFISDQISEIALQKTSKDTVLARLGDKGVLRPDLYEISYPPDMSFIQGRGIRHEHIRRALNYPDDVEHVLPEDLPFQDDGSYSLYVKHQKYDDPTKNFSLLVVSSRQGYKQAVLDALRVYPMDVDIAHVRQPLDMLKAFMEKYGYIVKVGNQAGKFFFLAIVEYDPDKETFIVGVDFPKEPGPFQQLMRLKDTGKAVEVSMVYAVNEDAYKADLRKHGI